MRPFFFLRWSAGLPQFYFLISTRFMGYGQEAGAHVVCVSSVFFLNASGYEDPANRHFMMRVRLELLIFPHTYHDAIRHLERQLAQHSAASSP
jgi:hypothetical protein